MLSFVLFVLHSLLTSLHLPFMLALDYMHPAIMKLTWNTLIIRCKYILASRANVLSGPQPFPTLASTSSPKCAFGKCLLRNVLYMQVHVWNYETSFKDDIVSQSQQLKSYILLLTYYNDNVLIMGNIRNIFTKILWSNNSRYKQDYCSLPLHCAHKSPFLVVD